MRRMDLIETCGSRASWWRRAQALDGRARGGAPANLTERNRSRAGPRDRARR